MPENWERTLRFQRKVEEAWKSWRKRRKDKRRQVLAGKDLPELDDMVKARNGLCIAIFVCLCLPSINVFTHWFDMPKSEVAQYNIGSLFPVAHAWYQGLDLYGIGFAALFSVFVFVFDYSIYKRFGKEHSIMDYS